MKCSLGAAGCPIRQYWQKEGQRALWWRPRVNHSVANTPQLLQASRFANFVAMVEPPLGLLCELPKCCKKPLLRPFMGDSLHLASSFQFTEVHLKPLAGALALLFAVADPAHSQQNTAPTPQQNVSPSAPATASSSAPPSPNTLLDGTSVKLKLAENVTSATAKAGQHVSFEVVEEVDVNGVAVIAKGAQAVGTVTTAEPKKSMGRAGKLDVNIDSVRLIDGEKVMLSATKSEKGGGHTGAMAAGMVGTAIVFFPAAPLLLFIHGKDITIPEGTEITAFVAGDNRLDMSKFGPSGVLNPVADGATSTGAPAGNQVASLSVDSSVPGADIEIDGSFVGSTPSTLSVAPGQHTVTVKKKGYEDWTRAMNVAGNSVHLNADMTAKSN